MASDVELRQNINAAQRKAHYARGRRDGLQNALGMMEGVAGEGGTRGVQRQLRASLEAAKREAADATRELDAAYAAYNGSLVDD